MPQPWPALWGEARPALIGVTQQVRSRWQFVSLHLPHKRSRAHCCDRQGLG